MSFKFLIGLCIYKITPIKRNRYVFTSFEGHYSDNPRAISERLHKMSPTSEIIWLVRDEYKQNVPNYAKTVDINSFKAFWYRGTATAQIDNVYGIRASFKTNESFIPKLKRAVISFLTKKKRQPIFTTFHGTPQKRLGRDQVGNTVLDMDCFNTYLAVGDNLTAEVLSRVTFEKIPVKVLGTPRNDVLFKSGINLKNKLGIPEDKKVIMFAPTFRNDGRDVEGKNIYRSGLNQLESIDFDKLFQTLSKKFGGDWVMVCRFHYHVAAMVDWNTLNKKYPNRFINGNLNDDMADYLVCTDILLTDASSSMFDFCKTKKPCFLYFPDVDNYRSKERGFYIDIEELPFPLSVDFPTFIKNINEFEQDKYSDGVESLIKRIGSMDDENSSERIVNYIFDMCNKK